MKILVIQQKMIGDVLTSSVLFEALRHKYPAATLHYLINEHTYPVVQNNPFIDSFIFVSVTADKSKRELFKLAQSVKATNYDVVIDVYSKFSSNLIALFSGAKIKISKHKWYSSFIYSHTFKEAQVPQTNAGLAIENRLKLITPVLSETPGVIRPKIYLTQKEIEAAKAVLLEHNIDVNAPLFMISVLGTSANKTYPPEYMAKIIDAIAETTPSQILFNYIPNQKEEALVVYNFCKKKTQEHIFFNVFGKTLREFLAITKHCNALIGNEGGAVNMAKALNVPTFTIFSPWIIKEAWNMFEDGKTHVSIHLKDVKPKLYEDKTMKAMKKEAQKYYQLFSPDFITPKLKSFF